jgi:hypothetical protein
VANSLYLIGIGGTGSKVLEAVTQMASVGLFRGIPVRMLFVDADETNGNLTRSRTTLQECNQVRPALPWLNTTELEDYGLWSPFSNLPGSKRLDNFFDYNNLKANPATGGEPDDRAKLGYLFDVLYTEAERKASLDVGFRGRPAIGSAIMSQINLSRLSEKPWSTLIQRIQAEVGGGKRPSVLLVGSIFGGTGASGLPTIGRLLINKLAAEKITNVQVGAIFLLPYFQFLPNTEQQEIYARADQFGLNTESALRYYLGQASGVFSQVYLMGSPNRSEYSFSTGKEDQRNQSHLVELYGALAARHFVEQGNVAPGQSEVILMTRQKDKSISWGDIPAIGNARQLLSQSVRFAYLWLDSFYPSLKQAASQNTRDFLKANPWYGSFFKAGMFSGNLPGLDASQLQEAKAVAILCENLWRWVSDVQRNSSPEQVALFRCPPLEKLGQGMNGEMLAELVVGRTTTQEQKKEDQVGSIKGWLQSYRAERGGVRELVQRLYERCA